MRRASSQSFSAQERNAVIDEVEDAAFDLIIVGGGINGAGVAHDAALRGLKVLLLEQRDLAFGTSSRSSKLIHGGLRYLEHYHFKLVFEGTNERAALRKVAPHLVRPIKFALPVYESSRHPLWKMDLGLWLYDGLSLFKTEKRHMTVRSANKMLKREPLLNADGLSGGIIYYDCITDDARLTLENAIAAGALGARILTHAQVVRIDGLQRKKGKVTVTFRDHLSDRHVRVHAKGIVNCTGAWTDRMRAVAQLEGRLIRPSKGVHVVVREERLPVKHAVALIAPEDGRVFFVIPWNGRTVIGTTDTDDLTDPSELRIDLEDVEYLLRAANFAFPSSNLVVDDVFAGWVGLRPLINVESESASDVPREHQIHREGRMVTVAGGKLTTYRKMAAEIVDEAATLIHANCEESTTENAVLPGGIGLSKDIDAVIENLMNSAEISSEIATRLVRNYGVHAERVLRYGRESQENLKPVVDDSPVLLAEVLHAMDHELGCTLDDVFVRRTSVSLVAEDQGVSAAERVSEIMGKRLGWSSARRHAEVETFLHSVELTRAYRSQRKAASAEVENG